jgi:hypothetical protein
MGSIKVVVEQQLNRKSPSPWTLEESQSASVWEKIL